MNAYRFFEVILPAYSPRTDERAHGLCAEIFAFLGQGRRFSLKDT